MRTCFHAKYCHPLSPQRHRHRLAIEQAKAVLGDRLSTSQAVRDQHARGEDYFTPAPPDAVAYPSTEEVAAVVKICAEHKVPVIAWGTGTTLEGHVTAPHGGITIDLSGMNNVLHVNPEDFDCRVQAGVTRKALNEDIRATGLMFPVDPGARCLPGRHGGNVAQRHQRRALWHDEGERHRPDRGHSERQHHQDRRPLAQDQRAAMT